MNNNQDKMKKLYTVPLAALTALITLSILVSCVNPDAIKDDTERTTASGTTLPAVITTSAELTENLPIIEPPLPPDISVLGGVSAKPDHIEYKEGDKTALSVNLLLPHAEIPDNQAVEQKVREKLSRINSEILESVENIGKKYINDLKNGRDMLNTPSLSVNFTLYHFTEKAMSIVFTMSETNFFGESTNSCLFYNFELDSFGADITFDTMFSDRLTDNRQKVFDLIKEKAGARSDLYPGYEGIIDLRAPTCWYISGGKMIFRFDAYLLAPAGVGPVSFEFELSELSPFMSAYGRDLLDIK